MPWATAPWICPSTISGLMTGPQSSTSAYARTVTRPVSGSTSTDATWTAPENVGPGRIEDLRRFQRRASGRARGAGECAIRARSATDRPRPGTPRTLTRPPVSSRSAALASSAAAAIATSAARTVLAAPSTAPPCAMAPRLANVPVPGGAVVGVRLDGRAPTRSAHRAGPPRAERRSWRAPGPATERTREQTTLPSAAIETVAASCARHVHHAPRRDRSRRRSPCTPCSRRCPRRGAGRAGARRRAPGRGARSRPGRAPVARAVG